MHVTTHLRIVGALLLALAAIHVFFPARFRWREELPRLSRLNQQMFLVHVLFIVLMLVMMGVLSALFTEQLVTPTPLAVVVLASLAIFWGLRLIVQWFVYDRALWWGQPFPTAVHLIFTALWTYFTVVYSWALGEQL